MFCMHHSLMEDIFLFRVISQNKMKLIPVIDIVCQSED